MLALREWVGAWHFSALTLLAVCLGVLPGSQSAGTDDQGAAYAVSQACKLLVHDSGNVDVVMQIDFHLDPGVQLKESYKTILSDTSIQSIEADSEHPGGRVIATDSAGRSLDLTLTEGDGRIRVELPFPEAVVGTALGTTYTIKLAYTVVNGICLKSLRFRHISLPWAHLWAVTVRKSKYEIEFANQNMELIMDTVCFGALGFSLECGHELLSIIGRQASYQASGLPHGVFFEWSGTSSNPGDRQCTDQEAGGLDSVLGTSADAPGLPGQDKPASAALTVGMITIGSSCLFAVLICTCAFKLPPRKTSRKFVRQRSNDDAMMTMGDEADIDGGGWGSASGDSAIRRPKPKPLDADLNDDLQQQLRQARTRSFSDLEAPAEPHFSEPAELKDPERHDSGSGVWSPGSGVRSGDGLEDDDPESDEGPESPSGPPPVPRTQLRSHGVAANPADDWEAMSEFDEEDDIERGDMMRESGQVDTLTAPADSEIPPMHNSAVPMQQSSTNMFAAHTSSDSRFALADRGSSRLDQWETMDEFSDTGSRCNASLVFDL